MLSILYFIEFSHSAVKLTDSTGETIGPDSDLKAFFFPGSYFDALQ